MGGLCHRVNILRKCKLFVSFNLEQLELDATVSACVHQRQPVEAGQQQLHEWQEGLEAAHVVVAQGLVQTGIKTCLLQL